MTYSAKPQECAAIRIPRIEQFKGTFKCNRLTNAKPRVLELDLYKILRYLFFDVFDKDKVGRSTLYYILTHRF